MTLPYVLVASDGHQTCPQWTQPGCTCQHFGRYAACEHETCVRMLDLRVRDATLSGEKLPNQPRRGRKKGRALTERGRKAVTKETLKQGKRSVRPVAVNLLV